MPQVRGAGRQWRIVRRAIRGEISACARAARARALTGLAPHLPPDQRPAVLVQAFTAATAIPDDSDRARALAGLAPQRPLDLLAQAFTAAATGAVAADSDRARALTGLAPHLPPDLLAQALTAATAIPTTPPAPGR